MADVDARPLARFIKLDANGKPFLEGVKCAVCGEVILEPRRACPKCATPGSLKPAPLAERGTVYSYTVVHRSFPGVTTPFISALVDLDGGGSIRGSLAGVASEQVRFGMPVRIVFEDLELSPNGTPGHYIGYSFAPESA